MVRSSARRYFVYPDLGRALPPSNGKETGAKCGGNAEFA